MGEVDRSIGCRNARSIHSVDTTARYRVLSGNRAATDVKAKILIQQGFQKNREFQSRLHLKTIKVVASALRGHLIHLDFRRIL